jgi:hypothetical protein
VSFDPATTGEAPISWGLGALAGGPGSEADEHELVRRLGFAPTELERAVWLPDDPPALELAVAESGLPFNGAYVPLVIHDPLLAERSYDAAEWAADLIRGAGGRRMAVAPHAEKEWVVDTPLTRRQWNHTVAMIERLEELCGRFRLVAVISDTVGDDQAREDGAPDPSEPVHHVLDAGSFVPDGFVAGRLISPEKLVVESNLTDRLRDFLRNRS